MRFVFQSSKNVRLYNRLSFRVSFYLIALMTGLLWAATWRTLDFEQSRDELASINRGKVAALAGAAACRGALEMGVASGALKLEELTDPKYIPIHYPFEIDHDRFHTGFDSFTDAHITGLEDTIFYSSTDFRYASLITHDGYVPTTNAPLRNEPTADKEWTKKNARKKMKYTDEVVLTAARFRGDLLTPVLKQDYHRDTGGAVWDLAAPVYVYGQFFGTFRVGVSWVEVEARRVASAESMLIMFGILTGIVAVVMFLVVTVMMRPLAKLTKQARAIGDGLDFESPVTAKIADEVGRMAEAVESMRIGLRAWYRKLAKERAAKERVADDTKATTGAT